MKTMFLRLAGFVLILLLVSCTGQGKSRADLYDEGKSQFDTGEYISAEESLRGFLDQSSQDPREDDAYILLAKARIEQERWDEAKTALDELILNYPTSPLLEEADYLLGLVQQKRTLPDEQKTAQAPVTEEGTEEGDTQRESIALPSNASQGVSAYLQAMTSYKASPSKANRDKVERLIDKDMSLDDLSQAIALPQSRSADGFPMEWLQTKQVLLAMHLRQFDTAKSHGDAFLKDYPASSFTPRVKRVLADIAAMAQLDRKKIGVILPLSGSHKVYGERAKKAVDLALKLRLAEQGIDLVYADSAGDGVGVAKAMRKLVLEDHVLGVVGPLLRKEALEAAYAAEEYQVPLMSLSSAPGVPEVGSYVFRLATMPRQQVQALVDYEWTVREHRTFAMLIPQHPYGEDMAQAFWDEVKKRGGEIVAVERYEDGVTTFSTPVKKLVGRYHLSYRKGGYGPSRSRFDSTYQWKKAREKFIKNIPPVVTFDALFIPDFYKSIGLLAPALAFEDIEVDTKRPRDKRRIAAKRRRTGRDIKVVQLLGTNGWNNRSLGELGGKYVEGAVFTDSYFVDGYSTGAMAYFASNFSADYKRNPTSLEAHAFDGVSVMAEAMKSSPKTRNELRASLAGIRDFEGATGRLSFDLSGEAQRSMMLLTIYDGKTRELNRVTETMQKKQEALEKAGKVKSEEELIEEFENDETPAQSVD